MSSLEIPCQCGAWTPRIHSCLRAMQLQRNVQLQCFPSAQCPSCSSSTGARTIMDQCCMHGAQRNRVAHTHACNMGTHTRNTHASNHPLHHATPPPRMTYNLAEFVVRTVLWSHWWTRPHVQPRSVLPPNMTIVMATQANVPLQPFNRFLLRPFTSLEVRAVGVGLPASGVARCRIDSGTFGSCILIGANTIYGTNHCFN